MLFAWQECSVDHCLMTLKYFPEQLKFGTAVCGSTGLMYSQPSSSLESAYLTFWQKEIDCFLLMELVASCVLGGRPSKDHERLAFALNS